MEFIGEPGKIGGGGHWLSDSDSDDDDYHKAEDDKDSRRKGPCRSLAEFKELGTDSEDRE